MSRIKYSIDILLITETKLGTIFPIGQFHTEEFSTPIRLTATNTEVELYFFSREGIPLCHRSQMVILAESFFFFFYLGFLSQPFMKHRTAGEGGGHFFNSSLLLPPASQTLRHYPGDYYRELTSAHRQQPDSNRELWFPSEVANH